MRVSWFPLFLGVVFAISLLENQDGQTTSNPSMHVAASESKQWLGSHMRVVPKQLLRRSEDMPTNQSSKHQEALEINATSTKQDQDSKLSCIGRACEYLGRACLTSTNITWNCVQAVDNEQLLTATAHACAAGAMGCILVSLPMIAKNAMQGLPRSELAWDLLFCSSALLNTAILARTQAYNNTAPHTGHQSAAHNKMLLTASRACSMISAGCLLSGIAMAVNDKMQDLPISQDTMHLVMSGEFPAFIGWTAKIFSHPTDLEAVCNNTETVHSTTKLKKRDFTESTDQGKDNPQCSCIFLAAACTAAVCGTGTLAIGFTSILVETMNELPLSNPSVCLTLLGASQLCLAPLIGIFAEEYAGRHCQRFGVPRRRQDSQRPVTAPIETGDVCYCDYLEPAVLETIRNSTQVDDETSKLEKRADPANLEAACNSTRAANARIHPGVIALGILGLSSFGTGCGLVASNQVQDMPTSVPGVCLMVAGLMEMLSTPIVATCANEHKESRGQRSAEGDSDTTSGRTLIEIEDDRYCEPLEPAPAYTRNWNLEAPSIEIWEVRRIQ